MKRFKSGDLELYNLRVNHVRKVNGRVVCDVINGDGTLVLSGNVDWVQRICEERDYEIENAEEANAKVDAIYRIW